MKPEFAFKLGLLFGLLEDYTSRAHSCDLVEGDTARVQGLVRDIKKMFFAIMESKEEGEEQ